MRKRPPLAARWLFLGGIASFTVSFSAGLVDYMIYPTDAGTVLCTEFGDQCGRAYTYFAFEAVQLLAAIAGLIVLVVAVTRAIRTRSL